MKYLHSLLVALLSSWAFLGACFAHSVGYQLVKSYDTEGRALEIGIWYPTTSTAWKQRLGAIEQVVAISGNVAGHDLALVVFSHGHGGSLLDHHDTAYALAQAGFVVATITHPGDNHRDRSRTGAVLDRAQHISMTLDFMLSRWPDFARLDANRIGVFGFSVGGLTALVSIGGAPDLSLIGPLCRDYASDLICQAVVPVSRDRWLMANPHASQHHDSRIRAAVLAAPVLGFTLSAERLKRVTAPVQLWRAEHDIVAPDPWNVEPIRRGLPRPTTYHVVTGAGHFDFVAPCSSVTSRVMPQHCESMSGFDRAQFHAYFNQEVVTFFLHALGEPTR